MTDDPHKSQAAWQDVEQVLQQEPDLHVLKILIADARAADARQIAALTDELRGRQCAEHPQAGMEWACEECYGQQVLELQQQIAALRAEKDELQEELDQQNSTTHALNLAAQVRKLEAQLTALQAEQAQWQREATKWLQRADHGFDPEEPEESVSYWQGVRRCAESILAALTAQQDTPR